MALTASWTGGATTRAWAPSTAGPPAAVPHGSREVLNVSVPGADAATTRVDLAVVPSGYVPDEEDWQRAACAAGTAAILFTADVEPGIHVVWARVRVGFEAALRIAATLVVEPGPLLVDVPDVAGICGRVTGRIGQECEPLVITPGTAWLDPSLPDLLGGPVYAPPPAPFVPGAAYLDPYVPDLLGQDHPLGLGPTVPVEPRPPVNEQPWAARLTSHLTALIGDE